MRVHFVGADLEESLGMGILAAVVERAGHRWQIVSFNDPAETAEVARRALSGAPDVIGLSIQFQHRAPEFLALARALRDAGFRGHLTAGGQFPTLAWQEALLPVHGLDSVVLHDGEETLVELLEALERKTPLSEVRGLALPSPKARRRCGRRRAGCSRISTRCRSRSAIGPTTGT
jgi:anaerobic magnesium-protoporphyrin IX monomethyl ester cyclase